MGGKHVTGASDGYEGRPTSAHARMTVEQEQAFRVAGRHAWRYLLPTALFRQCVTQATSAVEKYARAHHIIERRRIELGIAPAHGRRKKDEQALPDAEEYDPWGFEDHELVAETTTISRCPACDGSKKVFCPHCGGSAHRRCGQCNGGGVVSGKRGTKNCPSCRGRGHVKCGDCRSGKIDCETCDTAGRVEAWLTIVPTRIDQVFAHPKCASLLVHKRAEEPADFDADPSEWPSELLADTGHQPPSAAKVSPKLAAKTDAEADRVLATRVQRFSSSAHRFCYATQFSKGVVAVAGDPAAVSPASKWKALHVRLGVMGGALLCYLVVLGWVVSRYNAQSAWHAQLGRSAVVGWLGLASAAVASALVAVLTLPRRTWASPWTYIPGGAWGALVAATMAAFMAGGPTSAEADLAIAEGDAEHARLVADSLIALRADVAGGEQILDRLHLQRVTTAEALSEKLTDLGSAWYGSDYRAQAEQAVRQTVKDRGDAYLEACDANNLDTVAGYASDVDPPYAALLTATAALCRVPACSDCDCILRHLDAASAAPADAQGDARSTAYTAQRGAFDAALASAITAASAGDRVTALEHALASAPCVGKLGNAVDADTLARAEAHRVTAQRQLDAETAAAARLAEAKRKQEEAQRRREEAIAKQKEAMEEARQASLRLMCCDGTVSPSCLCNAGSHRGCCSRHKGVCGCQD